MLAAVSAPRDAAVGLSEPSYPIGVTVRGRQHPSINDSQVLPASRYLVSTLHCLKLLPIARMSVSFVDDEESAFPSVQDGS